MQQIILQLPGVNLAILTILLVLIFLSAWKAPRWVRPIGSIALGFCALSYLFSFFFGLYDINRALEISTAVMIGGLKIWNFFIVYGLLIYFVSHVISFIRKPGH
jgi:hypothetical protein